MSAKLQVSMHDGIVLLTLNRPEVRNALDVELRQALRETLQAIAGDRACQAVIFTGAGKDFCSGYDLKEWAVDFPRLAGPEAMRDYYRQNVLEMLQIWELPQPTIAAVNGHALAAGCELTMMCDLTVASERARFGEPEIRHVATPPTLIMPWLVGPKLAKELILLGEIIDAQRAYAIGLVNRVVPHETLLDEAFKLARRLAATPGAAVRLNKVALNRTFEIMGLRAALDYMTEITVHVHLSEGALDAPRAIQTQGLKAFLAQRDAGLQEP